MNFSLLKEAAQEQVWTSFPTGKKIAYRSLHNVLCMSFSPLASLPFAKKSESAIQLIEFLVQTRFLVEEKYQLFAISSPPPEPKTEPKEEKEDKEKEKKNVSLESVYVLLQDIQTRVAKLEAKLIK